MQNMAQSVVGISNWKVQQYTSGTTDIIATSNTQKRTCLSIKVTKKFHLLFQM
jgi:hypothetical protein